MDVKVKNLTIYPYGLNDRIEDKDQRKSCKECKDLIGKSFRSLPRVSKEIIMYVIKTRNAKVVYSISTLQVNLNIGLNVINLSIDHSIIASQILLFNKFIASMAMAAAAMNT